MKLTDHLKDRLTAYLIYGISWVLVLIFMAAFRISFQAIAIVSLILLLAVIAAELWGYFRKKGYYDKLLHCLDELDKKYLLSEMTEKPDFLDGRILYEIMQETNKSMCEHIAEYRRENKEFREYIELWVHEIKLPVASVQLMCHNDGNAKYAEQLRRIDNYIENVLYYARSGNAEKDYIIKPVSLKRAFADIAVKNREELQERSITLRTEGLDVNVMTDGKWLGFILGQLMGNSMKYDAAEISVTAEDLQDKITNFDLWVIEINEKNNPDFEPLDLFIRLNNKPYPIKDDTFEMWNSYLDRELINTIKASYRNNASWFFMRKASTRMENENNYTVLSYFNYLEQNKQDATEKGPLDIYKIGGRIAIRLRSKGDISKVLENAEKKDAFVAAINGLEFSFIRNLKTLLTDNKDEEAK